MILKTRPLRPSLNRSGAVQPSLALPTQRLHEALSRRHEERDETNLWMFWHTCFDLTGKKKTGPYRDRHKIMRSLFRKAGVKYFRFHALRHASAPVLDQRGARLGDIQKILGHENWRTTGIYLHSIGDDQREAIATLEQSPGKILTQSLT